MLGNPIVKFKESREGGLLTFPSQLPGTRRRTQFRQSVCPHRRPIGTLTESNLARQTGHWEYRTVSHAVFTYKQKIT